MQITPLWQKFKQLGLLDKEIITLTDTQKSISAQIKQLRLSLAERTALVEKMTAQQKKIHHEVLLKESEISAVIEKIKTKEQRLEQAKSTKEELAFKHEITALKQTCNTLEDACLEQIGELEKINNFLHVDVPASQEKWDEETQLLINLEAAFIENNATAQSNHQKQEVLIGTITPEWFSKYQAMKASIPDPITPVMQNTCGSCFYEVLAQDLVRLKLNAILPCRSCFRLLYCDTEQSS